MNLILVLTSLGVNTSSLGVQEWAYKKGGISEEPWNGKITLKQAVAELIKIQFAFTSFKFKLQYIWNEAYNLLEVFFLFTGR